MVRGEVVARRPGEVVVDVGGVGYRLHVSAETFRQVPAVGERVALHTQLIVRDDALTLVGFATEEERELFQLLLGVQSVGPKMALGVLGGGSPRELRAAIAAGEVARLRAVPGIGKRIAERIVAELRDKVDAADDAAVAPAAAGGDGPRAEARDGLLDLGFAPAEVESLLQAAEGETVEELIQSALRAAAR
jgi:Holliday junction DNA helicase RuvA